MGLINNYPNKGEPMTRHKEQRVAVFVDVQNLYYSAKNLYGRKVNFAMLLKNLLKQED